MGLGGVDIEVPTQQDKIAVCPAIIRRYSMKEVRQHCDETSCWIVVRDRVYDVTQFLAEHPGGTDIILENAGRDATVTFEDKGHSGEAYEILKQYCIGNLVEEERLEREV